MNMPLPAVALASLPHARELQYLGQTLYVDYTYTPEERATHDCPGCPEEVRIEAIYHQGQDVTALVRALSGGELVELEEAVLAEIAKEAALYGPDDYEY